MSVFLNILLCCFQYVADLVFFLLCAFVMFYCFLTHTQNHVQQPPSVVPKIHVHGGTNTSITMVKADSPRDQEVQTSNSFLAVAKSHAEIKDFDDTQLSFLLFSAGDVSGYDSNISTNFDRLKAQSMRTIQMLVDNRNQMRLKTTSARLKKERQKRAKKVWKARHCFLF